MPVVPPMPVWIRVPGTRGPDMGHAGWIHRWWGTVELGARIWAAEVTTEDDPRPRWVGSSSVLERDDPSPGVPQLS